MKKIIGILLALMTVMPMALAGPWVSIGLIGTEGLSYEEEKFKPYIFLNTNGGRELFDDPYGFYENGNIESRPNSYAFTGEQVQWTVLVWDKNGVEKVSDVWAGWVDQVNGPLDPEKQVNCWVDTLCADGDDLTTCGYPNVRRDGDQEPQSTFNSDTMQEYVCTLTIEESCHGQKWVGVKVEDLDELTDTMNEAESWFCNPVLDLYVSGSIDFGTLGPGEQASSSFSIENAAEAGSGAMVVVAISGKDFYDPTSSGAKCPSTNVLDMQGDGLDFSTGFWYSAVQGVNSVGPKRIPYQGASSIQDADPIFSTSNGLTPKWTGTLNTMSPGSEMSMTLNLGIPQPCNGQFTDGQIYLYAWAV